MNRLSSVFAYLYDPRIVRIVVLAALMALALAAGAPDGPSCGQAVC